MNKISCDVCMDLIPLVLDDVASTDSKFLVEEHIKTCDICKNVYLGETQVETQMNDSVVANKIKNKIFYFALATIILGTVFGLSIAAGEFMFYNIVIMPLIGAVGYIALKNKSYYILIFIFINVYLRWLYDTIGYGAAGEWLSALISPLLWATIYTGLCALGIIIAFLLHFGFRKEKKNEKDS